MSNCKQLDPSLFCGEFVIFFAFWMYASGILPKQEKNEKIRGHHHPTITQAYGEIHPDLIDRHEMENFLHFDLNRDGLISLEEANRSINATIEEFAQVDANNDGFVHPAKLDVSLK